MALFEAGITLDENHCRDIIGLLKDVQKGLTIEEISKKTGLTGEQRLVIGSSLFVAGHVDMKKTRPGKVFTL